MKKPASRYEYEGKIFLLNFIWITLNSFFLHDKPRVVGLLVFVGLCILFGTYNYIRHIPYTPYLILALLVTGLAIADWINIGKGIAGRAFFFIVLAGAILYHLWLFLEVGKIFRNNEQKNTNIE